jgi:hypothetical protein
MTRAAPTPPERISVVFPVLGSSLPSLPVACAVYQTDPSGAGATSCGCVPGGTGYSRTRRATEEGPPERPPLARQDAADDAEPAVPERPEDDRFALLERLAGRLLDDDAVRDEDGERPRAGRVPISLRASRICFRHAASCSEAIVLRSAGCTVARPNASRAVSSVRQ